MQRNNKRFILLTLVLFSPRVNGIIHYPLREQYDSNSDFVIHYFICFKKLLWYREHCLKISGLHNENCECGTHLKFVGYRIMVTQR